MEGKTSTYEKRKQYKWKANTTFMKKQNQYKWKAETTIMERRIINNGQQHSTNEKQKQR